MKKLAMLVVALMFASVPAFADDLPDLEFRGQILIGDGLGLVQSSLEDCESTVKAEGDGIDGDVVAIPAEYEGHDAAFVADGDEAINDIDIQWYDADCKTISSPGWATAGNEVGKVPANGRFAELILFTGANVHYYVAVSGAAPTA